MHPWIAIRTWRNWLNHLLAGYTRTPILINHIFFEGYWDAEHPAPPCRKRKHQQPTGQSLRGSTIRRPPAPPPTTSVSLPPPSSSCDVGPEPLPLCGGPNPQLPSSCDVNNIITSSSRDESDTTGIHVAPTNAEPDGAGLTIASPTTTMPLKKAQYEYIDYTNYYQSYKRQRGINGAILIHVSGGLAPAAISTPPQPLILSAFTMLPLDIPDCTIHAFPVVNNKDDTPTQSQMLRADDNAEFIASQPAEINGLLKMGVFKTKHISEKPPQARLLSSIWSYRRKRSPVSIITKCKSRICVDGSQQEYGRDYCEVYAPIVSWSTIRLMLLLSSILNLKQRQVDYTQAFPQALLSDPVYMRVPQGWYVDDKGALQQHQDPTYNDKSHFIQLKCNLYGCKQAARNWFKHLTQGLLSKGFWQSTSDPCLFLHSCGLY